MNNFTSNLLEIKNAFLGKIAWIGCHMNVHDLCNPVQFLLFVISQSVKYVAW